MSGVRSKVDCIIPIIVIIYGFRLINKIIYADQLLGIALAYVIYGIMAVAAGGLAVLIFNIVNTVHYNTAHNIGGIDKSVKSLLYWFTVIVGGVIAYRRFPIINNIIDIIFEYAPKLASLTLDFIIRLTPFNVFGIYVTVIYISFFIMLAVCLISAILDSVSGFMNMLAALKVPLFLGVLAIILSVSAYRLIGPHMMWVVFYLMAIIGQHHIIGKVVSHISFSSTVKAKGVNIYLSIKNIKGSKYNYTADDIAVYIITGISYLTQAILIITFIVYIAFNFTVLRDTTIAWFN